MNLRINLFQSCKVYKNVRNLLCLILNLYKKQQQLGHVNTSVAAVNLAVEHLCSLNKVQQELTLIWHQVLLVNLIRIKWTSQLWSDMIKCGTRVSCVKQRRLQMP